jgi:hypothetical protein
MRELQPDHNTIANFRKNNPKAIKHVFRATVQLAKHFDLIGGTLIAGDSTKLRAQNSKKNNFNPKKIDLHLKRIDEKLEQYNLELAKEDGDATYTNEAQEKIKKYQAQRSKYEQLQQELKESGDTQISTSDPDSRQMITRNHITEVAYNIQTSVDAKHNLRRILNILDKNLLKAYLKGLGLYFWPFQRPFKAIFRHSGFLGWESEFFVRLFFGMLKCQKMV